MNATYPVPWAHFLPIPQKNSQKGIERWYAFKEMGASVGKKAGELRSGYDRVSVSDRVRQAKRVQTLSWQG